MLVFNNGTHSLALLHMRENNNQSYSAKSMFIAILNYSTLTSHLSNVFFSSCGVKISIREIKYYSQKNGVQSSMMSNVVLVHIYIF